MLLANSFLAFLLFSTCAIGSLVDDIVYGIEGAVDCGGCHALLFPLQGLAYLGDSVFSDTIIAVCKVLRLEDPDVCQGAIAEQAPIISHNLRSISAFGETATKLCDVLFGLCQPPPVNPFSVPFPKPAPTNPKTFVSTGKTPFQVVHFSDVHIDRQYATGSEANCSKPICCRDYSESTGTPAAPAGPFGNHNCDTPPNLVQSMLRGIAANNAFSIFTGDVVEAAVWLLTQDDVIDDMDTFNGEMATILGAPVYPTIGNHEVAPVNSFPRHTTSAASAQYVFDTLSTGWAPWINSTGAEQVKHFSGSYSAVVPGTNLRIISINDIYWYKNNFWLYDSDAFQPDPNDILAFTVQELQAAEDAGQRAWIIAHMAPGRGDTLSDQSNYFDQVVQRYHNTIAGQFYGHSHQDQFAIAYSNYSQQTAANAVSVGWIAPALTPRGGNPEFKMYDVDPDTYEIMDARVFMSNLSDPTFQTNPTWKLRYSARETYGSLVGLPLTESLSPAFWHRVTEVFITNDTAFQQYNMYRSRRAVVPPCNGTCKSTMICDLRALRAENNCNVATPGTPGLKSYGEETLNAISEDECEPSRLRDIMSRIFGAMSGVNRDTLIAHMEEAIWEANSEEPKFVEQRVGSI